MRVAQEPDQVNPRVIVIVAALTVVATAAGTWAAWLLQKQGERAIGVSASESVVARWGHPPEEQNAIEMSLFGRGSRPLRETDTQSPPPRAADSVPTARLGTYGWADRAEGTVHIPIDRAMLLYLAKTAEARGASPARPPGGATEPAPPAGRAP